jgi:hypothetical protein
LTHKIGFPILQAYKNKVEGNMPKVKGSDIDYDQLRGLVLKLEFKKKMSLIKEIIREKEYRDNFYHYSESLLEKYNIPQMTEDELDAFLH